MSIDPSDLRKHFASLSDEGLLLVEREDLTPIAQEIFDFEIGRRGLQQPDAAPKDDVENATETSSVLRPSGGTEVASAWLERSFPVTVFSGMPSSGVDAEDVRNILLAAGIPCEIVENRVDPADEPVRLPYQEYQVMVPNALILWATSVLDTEYYNPRLEEDWKTQFESLSTDELRQLSVDALCAGMLDRAERLRKAYKAELLRRSS